MAGTNFASPLKVGGVEIVNSSGQLNASVDLADDDVSIEHLDDGILPSHVVKFAANYTTTGGAAAEAITVTGAAATDIPLVTMQDDGTSNVTIVSAVITANTLTITFSADPGNDTVVSYVILRAAA